jgi:hypothetical protein
MTLTNSDGSLFIALSTSQNITNLLPILELAERGDRVLWIESARAQHDRWSEMPLAVLKQHNVVDIETVSLADDSPESVYRALAERTPTLPRNVRLLGNGGTKPQMLAAAAALVGRIHEFLYNHDNECVLQCYQGGPQGRMIARPYQRHGLDLGDVLKCRNMQIKPDAERRIWPNSGPLPPLPDYGTDPSVTRDHHRRIWEWERQRLEPPSRRLGFKDAERFAPDQTASLERNILHACGCPGTQRVDRTALENVYNSAHKLSKLAAENQPKRTPPEEAPDIGQELEEAVSARLLHWLHAKPTFAAIVQSVWKNVKICRNDGKEANQELDVVLMLKNARLFHLECKSFMTTAKEMDASLGGLQRNTTQLATMAICVPSYPEFERDEWCKQLKDNIKTMKKWQRFDVIEFTMPERRPSFEDALDGWLKGSLPRYRHAGYPSPLADVRQSVPELVRQRS